MRFSLGSVLAALMLTLAACQPLVPWTPSQGRTPTRAQSQSVSQSVSQSKRSLQVAVLSPDKIPVEIQTRTQAQAQVYADEVSKRRGIDLFYVHPVPIALQLNVGEQKAWVLSYPGTSRLRNDLNLELRALVSGQSGAKAALNLNYSGPVTLGRSDSQEQVLQPVFSALEKQLAPRQDSQNLSFELITGLPGNGVTEAYGDHLEGLQQFLRSRFQARPFAFDDGPLIYAVHQGQTLLGFVFQNQRNRLILGERKYADVQSMVLVSSSREILASYTVVGFNPKTAAPDQLPVYSQEDHGNLGSLFIFGEY
jgi:hypothetical protein